MNDPTGHPYGTHCQHGVHLDDACHACHVMFNGTMRVCWKTPKNYTTDGRCPLCWANSHGRNECPTIVATVATR